MSAATAWDGALEGGGAASAPEKPAPTASPLPTLSLSSSVMRWASFGPTPEALVKALWSPEETASATFSGDRIDRIESPALGPTPETAVSILKQLRCSSFKKP